MNKENPEGPFCYYVLDPSNYSRNRNKPYFAPNELWADCCKGCINKYENGDAERESRCLSCLPEIDKYYRQGEPFILNRATSEANKTEIVLIIK
jgi:hypothetical protein